MASGYMGQKRWEVWPGTLFWSYVKDPLARQRTGWPPGGENISHLLSSRYQYIVVGWGAEGAEVRGALKSGDIEGLEIQ